VAEPRYDVRLDLTRGDETFASETTVAFTCPQPGAGTFIEFIGPAVERMELNGKALPAVAFDGGRIQLTDLQMQNVLKVSATAKYMRDGTGLHRFVDPLDGRAYLHSSFESNDAHRVFTCFDQPDLKGTFTFEVHTPADWTVISNTPGVNSAGVWRFPTTKVISTYLAAVVAGEYHFVQQKHRDIALGIYCRQSLARYLDPDEIFEITRSGLDYFEARYGIPYMLSLIHI